MLTSANPFIIVIILEAFLCVYSLVLGYMSEKKLGKLLNFCLAFIWALAAVLNLISL